ncbi:MAG: hypothetical protein H7Y33_16240 [Cytophagales bacterium]|nr:hypothetical protein [Rhizobacter sp.]
MSTLVRTTYLESEFGVPTDLEGAGTSLENPYAYDSAARDLKSMADQGLVRIVREEMHLVGPEPLINHIRFARLR